MRLAERFVKFPVSMLPRIIAGTGLHWVSKDFALALLTVPMALTLLLGATLRSPDAERGDLAMVVTVPLVLFYLLLRISDFLIREPVKGRVESPPRWSNWMIPVVTLTLSLLAGSVAAMSAGVFFLLGPAWGQDAALRVSEAAALTGVVCMAATAAHEALESGHERVLSIANQAACFVIAGIAWVVTGLRSILNAHGLHFYSR